MLVEMRARSKITLPSEITKRMGISEGDRFEVMERDGGVFLCPVVVYPKVKLERIAKSIDIEGGTKAPILKKSDLFFAFI